MIKTVEWTDEGVRMIDQRLLPTEEKYLMLRSCEEVADAIRQMVVRGAPAIGVSAAMGIALGTMQSVGTAVADLEEDFDYFCDLMSGTRPTAVNLFWAIERMRERSRPEKPPGGTPNQTKNRPTEKPQAKSGETTKPNRPWGPSGAQLTQDGS